MMGIFLQITNNCQSNYAYPKECNLLMIIQIIWTQKNSNTHRFPYYPVYLKDLLFQSIKYHIIPYSSIQSKQFQSHPPNTIIRVRSPQNHFFSTYHRSSNPSQPPDPIPLSLPHYHTHKFDFVKKNPVHPCLVFPTKERWMNNFQPIKSLKFLQWSSENHGYFEFYCQFRILFISFVFLYMEKKEI